MKWLFTCLTGTAFAVSAICGELKVANAGIELDYANGAVKVFRPGAGTPVAVLTPSFPKNAVIKATTIERTNCRILSLRSGADHVAFKLEGNDPAFTVTLNCGASPVSVEWAAKAVVIPDRFAEDQVITPDGKTRRLPPFVPLYLGLLGDDDAALACIPVRSNTPAELSGDLKTLKIFQQNTEDYTFVLNAGPGVWHSAKLPEKPGEAKTLDDWPRPYPALWRVAVPLEKDFIAPGDNSYVAWNIITVPQKKGRTQDNPQRGSIQDVKTRRFWLGGFESQFRYPMEFLDGKAILTHPSFGVNLRIEHSVVRPSYIYSVERNQLTPPEVKLPMDFLPPWEKGHDLYRSTNLGIRPTTCSTTANFEKIFYRGETPAKTAEIVNMLASMQLFVESMRSRVENARVWKRSIDDFAARESKLSPSLAVEIKKLDSTLNEIERLYAAALPRIKFPPEAEKLSAQVIELAQSDLDAEAKEAQAKKLGRAIRTIGGGQDNLAAYMRHIGKCVRFQALNEYMTAADPAAKEFWGAIYLKTEDMLQGYYNHDGK